MRPWTLFSWIAVVGLAVGNPVPNGRNTDPRSARRVNPENNIGASVGNAIRDPKLIAGTGIGAYLIWLTNNRRRSRRVTPGSPPIGGQVAPGPVDPSTMANAPSTPNVPPPIFRGPLSGRDNPAFRAAAPQWYKDIDRYLRMTEQQRKTEGHALIESMKMDETDKVFFERCKRQKDATLELRPWEATEELKKMHAHECRVQVWIMRMEDYEWREYGSREYWEKMAQRGIYQTPGERAASQSSETPPENVEFRLGDIKLPSVSLSMPPVNLAAIGSSAMKSVQAMPKTMPKFAVRPGK